MTWTRLVRAELRKLASTKMPWVFLAVLAVIGAINAAAVIFGTDSDGTKTFVSTAGDQQSLIAFAANAMMITGLFGAIAVAREYGHHTVIPTFLAAPRRHRAVLAQLTAAAIGGGVLGLVGAGLTTAALAASLPTTEFSFMVSGGSVARVLAASALAGAAGAILGAGLGALIRNSGGAVTAAVLTLVVAPPLLVQLASETSSWVPGTLANVLSGVSDTVSPAAALAVIVTWALVPATIGLVSVIKRDVV